VNDKEKDNKEYIEDYKQAIQKSCKVKNNTDNKDFNLTQNGNLELPKDSGLPSNYTNHEIRENRDLSLIQSTNTLKGAVDTPLIQSTNHPIKGSQNVSQNCERISNQTCDNSDILTLELKCSNQGF
jgi:hypothetical protein